MMTPTSSPTTTDTAMPCQLSSPSSHRMRNVAAIISTELRFVPRDSAASRFFMEAPSLVRTAKMPAMDSKMPTAAISMGAMTALNCITVSPVSMKAEAPSAAVERMEPQ